MIFVNYSSIKLKIYINKKVVQKKEVFLQYFPTGNFRRYNRAGHLLLIKVKKAVPICPVTLVVLTFFLESRLTKDLLTINVYSNMYTSPRRKLILKRKKVHIFLVISNRPPWAFWQSSERVNSPLRTIR